jgi:mitochondrial intermediate peptidase
VPFAHSSTHPSGYMLAHTARHVLSKSTRQVFRFRGCLQAKQEAFSRTTRSATTLSAPSPATADDLDIITDFDIPHQTEKSSGLAHTGLFGHDFLTTPASFIALANSTIARAHLLTRRIVKSKDSRAELFQVVKHLDRLSDLLCGVIDLAECVRNSHPDAGWLEAAEDVYLSVHEFMNILNTNTDLCDVRHLHIMIYSDSNTDVRSSRLYSQILRYPSHSDMKHGKPHSSSGGTLRNTG